MPEQSSPSTWCKICGITSLADARAAQNAGANALGFNCYEGSPRFITPQTLATLSAAVSVTRVALFVNATAAQVEHVLHTGQIDLLQFHGDEDEAFCASFGLPYMKAIRMRGKMDVANIARTYASAWALLLDAYVADKAGGTGEQFDWTWWPQLADTRLVLAGGLTPSNVSAAISRLRPFGVDVSSGVEGPDKGSKDHRKVAEFLQEVRSVGC